MLRSLLIALPLLGGLVSSKPLPEYEETVNRLKARQSTAPPGGRQEGDFTFYRTFVPARISQGPSS